MDDESDDAPGFFAEEVFVPRIAKTVEEYLPALAACVSPEEVEDLKKACEDAFVMAADLFAGDDLEDIFRICIPQMVQDALSKGAEEIRRPLRDMQWIREFTTIKHWIGAVAHDLYAKRISLTPELMKEVREKDGKLTEMLKILQEKQPHLTDRSLPKPILDISRRYMVGMWISDCINDFRYVLDYPDGRVMSLAMADRIRFGR
jgi:hypothetical protein